MSPKEINKAISHLKKDKVWTNTIKNFPLPGYKPGSDYFAALVRSIIYQQISGKAAESIQLRFKALFKKKMDAEGVLKLKDKQFKTAGISPQKMKYLRDLALKFKDGTINPSNFNIMTDEEIREHLIAVKGIGRWTADMFLMFTLNRPDVLPTGDLAIQKGFKNIFKMRTIPSVAKMEKLAKSWAPYRTIASHYLWRASEEK
jgi:3-methyladenine DNA glycosylase/8-oxoguanine DNA glycosylase